MTGLARSLLPLFLPDLDQEAEELLLAQVRNEPFSDPDLLDRWEAVWRASGHAWAVAVARPWEAVALLREHGALAGGVGVDPLLPPALGEAFSRLGIPFAAADLDQAGRPCADPPCLACGHAGAEGVLAVSATLPPAALPARFRLALLDANQPVAAGATAVLLGRDPADEAWFRRFRLRPPSALAAAMGLVTFSRFHRRLPRRQGLAARYATLHTRGLVRLLPPESRGWDACWLVARDESIRVRLQTFLREGGIACASPPVWRWGGLPMGAARFFARAVRLPFYPGLEDAQQKRVINRIHRFLEREAPRALFRDEAEP